MHMNVKNADISGYGMKNKTPCEYIVWYIIPCIRKGLAESMKKYGLNQKEIAEKLNISSAAVSQYFSNKRGKIGKIDEDLRGEIEKSAKAIIKGADVSKEICRICTIIKERINLKEKIC